MEIQYIHVMRGPNYWSARKHRLIAVKIHLGEIRNEQLGQIDGVYERLIKAIPTLTRRRCRGEESPLCLPVGKDTPLVQAIGRLAIELQHLAGMDCTFGLVERMVEPNTYRIVFCYTLENVGVFAAKAAIDMVRTALAGESLTERIEAATEYMESIYENEATGPSSQSIIDEARSRGIPAIRLDEDASLVMLGYGEHRKLFQATVMSSTSNIAVETVSSKPLTKRLLAANGIPVPQGVVVDSEEELLRIREEIPFPVVVKPIDGNHGRGITANIASTEDLLHAYAIAKKISDKVIVENYIEGDDYRFLVVDFKLVAVARRTPAYVTGNGASTIRELVDVVNADPDRGSGHEKILTSIRLNQHTLDLLAEQALTPDSIPAPGKRIYLKRTANLSTGGTSTDVTEEVHPWNKFMAERIARIVNLDVCGIDIIANDITQPLGSGNGAIIEVNAGPGFRMHTHPSHGKPRNVAAPVIDMLFPESRTGRIPVIAVTGTNGKTTTVRLIAQIARNVGKRVGYTTTEGIYIDGHVVVKGDCSGPRSAQVVLSDPLVDYAVLECARGGMLRSGLPFDQCAISIVTNVTEDHLGLGDIHTLEDYARVKEIVPQSTMPDGHAILNAEDPLVYAMKDRLRCNVVLFSLNAEQPEIVAHCKQGGMAVFVENDQYVICEGGSKTVIIGTRDIPLTFSGTATFMMKNILPAIAAAYLSGFDAAAIRETLKAFRPSPELTPGRMNLFDFGDFSVMLDYAHNAGAFVELEQYMAEVPSSHKVCIIAGTGDRRDQDIRDIGYYAARMFDEIIIRQDKDTRNRTGEQMEALLQEGIRSVNQAKPIRIIPDESEAIRYAVEHARPGTFIFACADEVFRSIEIIQSLQEASGE